MFGTYRLALALIVMAHHLLAIPVIGQYAVFSFFVLSGFLMTAVMVGTYGYGAEGFLRFAANRALRLYPAYFFAIFLGIIVIIFCGEAYTQAYRAAMFLPPDAGAWAANLSMVFPRITPYDFVPRILPATWALTVELVFYLLIGLGLSRTRQRSLLWLAASLAYTAVMLVAGADYYQLYSLVPSGSLAFATGACLWHWRKELSDLRHHYLPLRPEILTVAGLAWFMPFALIDKYSGFDAARLTGLYLNIPIASIVTIALFNVEASHNNARYDSFLGNYSYPVYLLHWPMGALASWMLFERPVLGVSVSALLAFALALLLTFAASSAVTLIIDPAIGRLRATIKHRRTQRNMLLSLPVEDREAA